MKTLEKVKELERELCKMDPQFFRETICGYEDFQDFHKELDVCWDGEKRRKLIMIPRGHLKSSWAMGRCLMEILNNPNITILYESAIYKNAKKYLKEMCSHINSAKWRELYGDWVGSPWSTSGTEFQVSTRTIAKPAPTVTASGLDVTQTGQHYDLIILDDLVDEKNHRTPEGREKALSRYRQAKSLLNPGGRIIVIGTPWDPEDMYAWIQKDENIKELFNIVHMSCYRKDGSILFPQKFCETIEEEIASDKMSFEALRLELKKEGFGEFIFSCQYLCNPEATDISEFKKAWLKHKPDMHIIRDMLRDPQRVCLFVDPALGRENSKEPCDVGIAGANFKEKRTIEVFLAIGERLTPFETVDKVLDYCDEYPITDVFVEAVVFQEVVAAMIELKLEEDPRFHGRHIQLHRVQPKGDKERRIRSMFVYYEYGQVIHAESLRDGKLEDELKRFPKMRLRDVIDALSQFCYTVDFPFKIQEKSFKPTVAPRYSMRAPLDKKNPDNPGVRSYLSDTSGEIFKVGV